MLKHDNDSLWMEFEYDSHSTEAFYWCKNCDHVKGKEIDLELIFDKILKEEEE